MSTSSVEYPSLVIDKVARADAISGASDDYDDDTAEEVVSLALADARVAASFLLRDFEEYFKIMFFADYFEFSISL